MSVRLDDDVCLMMSELLLMVCLNLGLFVGLIFSFMMCFFFCWIVVFLLEEVLVL